MNMQQTCDPDRLDAFVRGELSEQQESELTAHLDQCASCGEELEQRVAAADQWREASELLTHHRSKVVDLVKDPSASVVDLANDPRANLVDLANDSSASGGLTTSTTFGEQIVGMLAPTDDPEMLGRIGSYEVSGVVGFGGMGVVFKAHDRSLDRVVAIKVMAPHLAGSGAARKRFARESKAAAAVLHPNVIAIHCVADDPKLPYLVMPYIGGASLQKRVEADGPLCIQDTLRIGQQIAAGLAAAHAQGLVHRDIKPANILLERGVERVTITDFGLARAVDDATMTRSGVIAGTPQYMSPEQARGESIDHRSDLFSLGSVLYMMCAGHSPFRAETTFGILRRITDNQPRPLREINPEVPEWLCAIIEKLHAKEPSERFQSAEEVAELLEDCLAHVQQPTSAPLPASLVPLATTGRSVFNVTRIAVLMMLGILGMTLLGMVLWQATEPPDINGQWTSDEWGTVVLEDKGLGKYEGTFSGVGGGRRAEGDPARLFDGGAFLRPVPNIAIRKGELGSLHLKWSHVERRFNGTWKSGENRNGKMSLRLVNNEIRGAWTTNKGTQKESDSPRLADLTWKRSVVGDDVYGEHKTYEDPNSGAQHIDKKLPKTVNQASVDDKAPELVETPQPPNAYAIDPDTNHSRDLNGFLIAWDFNYPLLGKRMAKLRVSTDMHLESVFPGRPSVKGKAPIEDVKELVEFIATQVKWAGDIGAEYERSVSSMAEFERDDTSVRTERVAINLKGRVGELQLDKSKHLAIVNRLWRLEGIVAIGGQEGLTELLALAEQKLSLQFPKVRYRLYPDTFRFGIKDETGTRIANFRIPPDRNRPEMNFTLTVPPTGEPKFEQVIDEDSNDEPSRKEDPPKANGDARSPDSPKIYTVEELISNGRELIKEQQPVTVRVKVVSVRREGTVNADGTRAQHWWLSSKAYNGRLDPSAFKIRVSENAEKALGRDGVTDLPAHFTGKELTITGKLSVSVVDGSFNDDIYYDMSLDSLDQLPTQSNRSEGKSSRQDRKRNVQD